MKTTVLCPLHEIPMTYIGMVPAWQDRFLTVHAWHCSKCTAEIQRPIFPSDPTTTEPQKP